jgi:hypothetical protein
MKTDKLMQQHRNPEINPTQEYLIN